MQTDEPSAARISKGCLLDGSSHSGGGGTPLRAFSDLFTDETDVNLVPWRRSSLSPAAERILKAERRLRSLLISRAFNEYIEN